MPEVLNEIFEGPFCFRYGDVNNGVLSEDVRKALGRRGLYFWYLPPFLRRPRKDIINSSLHAQLIGDCNLMGKKKRMASEFKVRSVKPTKQKGDSITQHWIGELRRNPSDVRFKSVAREDGIVQFCEAIEHLAYFAAPIRVGLVRESERCFEDRLKEYESQRSELRYFLRNHSLQLDALLVKIVPFKEEYEWLIEECEEWFLRWEMPPFNTMDT